jgi:hypothetical protein
MRASSPCSVSSFLPAGSFSNKYLKEHGRTIIGYIINAFQKEGGIFPTKRPANCYEGSPELLAWQQEYEEMMAVPIR